jgi:hypothetical protein
MNIRTIDARFSTEMAGMKMINRNAFVASEMMLVHGVLSYKPVVIEHPVVTIGALQPNLNALPERILYIPFNKVVTYINDPDGFRMLAAYATIRFWGGSNGDYPTKNNLQNYLSMNGQTQTGNKLV